MARSIDKVELRGQVDKAVMDVLDACSIARGIDRISLVEKVLSDWAARKVSEASVLQRIARGNPAVMELAGILRHPSGLPRCPTTASIPLPQQAFPVPQMAVRPGNRCNEPLHRAGNR